MATTKVKNWRADPNIAECKELAKKHGYDIVLIIGIKGEEMCGSSYGVDGSLCTEGGRYLRAATKAIRESAGEGA